MVRAVLITLLILLLSPIAFASREQVVRYHTQEWENITNRDGTGLYHEIMEAIFTARGMEVETSYYPFKRSVANVKAGVADIAGGTYEDSDEFIKSRAPIWVYKGSVLFRKDLLPGWKGKETFLANLDQTVSTLDIGRVLDVDIREVKSRKLGIKMMLDGRMKYYLDDHTVLLNIISGRGAVGFEGRDAPEELGDVDWSNYVVREVATRHWNMVFPNNDRGRRIRDIFDDGLKRLYHSGELRRMYQKWGLEPVMFVKFPEE